MSLPWCARQIQRQLKTIFYPVSQLHWLKHVCTNPVLDINCVTESQNNNLGWKSFPEVIQSNPLLKIQEWPLNQSVPIALCSRSAAGDIWCICYQITLKIRRIKKHGSSLTKHAQVGKDLLIHKYSLLFEVSSHVFFNI